MARNGHKVDDPFRMGKAYTIREAATLADVSPGTVRNWLYGSTKGDMEPAFGQKVKASDEPAMVSFLDLAEIIVAARFRKVGIKLQRIRDAHDNARREYPAIAYPFAHLDLSSLGGHVLQNLREYDESHPAPGPRFVVLSSLGQYVLPQLVEEETRHFEYSKEDQLATRWYQYGPDLPVVVDPRFGGGKPTIAGRGVSVEIILRRWKAGEKIPSIAQDFRLKAPIVEAVLQRVA